MAPGTVRGKWISVHEWVIGPKLRKFARLAECTESESLGVLCFLWLWGINGNADKDGLLMEADMETIKSAFKGSISNELDPQRVAEALVESGWVDVRSGRYYISDWAAFQAYYDER